MKTLIKTSALLSFILFQSPQLLGQDQQWLIKDHIGRINNDIDQVNIQISNIDMPNTNQDSRAGDGIFMILNNGDFACNKFYYQNLTYSLGDSGVELTLNSDNVPMYLYLSNKYDDDDPNPITENADQSSNNYLPPNILNIQNESETEIEMFAHQNIVGGYDLVLTLAKDMIEVNKNYTIRLDSFTAINSTNGINLNGVYSPRSLFDGNPIFYSEGYVSFNMNSTGASELNFQISEDYPYPFLYFALHSNINKTLPLLPVDADDSSYEGNFILSADQQILAKTKEPVRGSHDPNEIYALERCIVNDCARVFYEGKFENETETSSGPLAMKLKMGEDISIQTIQFEDFVVNGNSVTSNAAIDTILYGNNNELTVVFKPNIRIQKTNRRRAGEGVILFRFCIQYKSGKGLNNFENLAVDGSTFFNYKNPSIEVEYPLIDNTNDRGISNDSGSQSSLLKIEDCTYCQDFCSEDPDNGNESSPWTWILIPFVIILIPIIYFKLIKPVIDPPSIQ